MLDTAWKPAKDTEHVLAAVAAVQAQHWPVLESISTPEAFAKAWEFYLLVSTAHPHGETCLRAHLLPSFCRDATSAALLLLSEFSCALHNQCGCTDLSQGIKCPGSTLLGKADAAAQQRKGRTAYSVLANLVS